MAEILVVTRIPWYQRSAFRSWVKDSFSTLTAVPIVDVAGLVRWRDGLIVAGVMILKGLLASMYEILYGKDPESYRETPPTAPTSPPDPGA